MPAGASLCPNSGRMRPQGWRTPPCHSSLTSAVSRPHARSWGHLSSVQETGPGALPGSLMSFVQVCPKAVASRHLPRCHPLAHVDASYPALPAYRPPRPLPTRQAGDVRQPLLVPVTLFLEHSPSWALCPHGSISPKTFSKVRSASVPPEWGPKQAGAQATPGSALGVPQS